MILKVRNNEGKDACTVKFINNLSIKGKPYYVNENGLMGITRIKGGTYDGLLVYMFVDVDYPENSYAEFIEEKEAYDLCWSKKKYKLIDKYNIQFEEEREVL